MDYQGKVAVVTGGGSGIGRALAQAFARRGARIVLADIEKPALDAVAAELERAGSQVLAQRVDVADPRQVARLADSVYEAFGAVHVLCNNAGVAVGGRIKDLSLEEWNWALGVNLFGVIHGLHAFLPRMLAGGEPGHIVNTASLAGMMSMAGLTPYSASKYAVVAISEGLAMECAGSNLGVSVVCPGWVKTRIAESDRHAGPEIPARPLTQEAQMLKGVLRAVIDSGTDPDEIAQRVLEGIDQRALYIFPNSGNLFDPVRARFANILAAGTPRA
ncbi:MAG TPA: SDR family NAD(P)-dependent oxidoreductase [Myxococcota bacterium]|jgi:NAD(P)-dependent dehydrogenase (short-subunit alcohol dehydrogenase family)